MPRGGGRKEGRKKESKLFTSSVWLRCENLLFVICYLLFVVCCLLFVVLMCEFGLIWFGLVWFSLV